MLTKLLEAKADSALAFRYYLDCAWGGSGETTKRAYEAASMLVNRFLLLLLAVVGRKAENAARSAVAAPWRTLLGFLWSTASMVKERWKYTTDGLVNGHLFFHRSRRRNHHRRHLLAPRHPVDSLCDLRACPRTTLFCDGDPDCDHRQSIRQETQSMQNGKGDTYRPVNQKAYAEGYERIFGTKPAKSSKAKPDKRRRKKTNP